jgi:hypothetical protein
MVKCARHKNCSLFLALLKAISLSLHSLQQPPLGDIQSTRIAPYGPIDNAQNYIQILVW